MNIVFVPNHDREVGVGSKESKSNPKTVAKEL